MSSCRPAHKPHKVNETVTVHWSFHPLAGTRATTLENRSHRGEPIVVVADSDGHRYHLPLWMTAPEAAQWGLRDRPRLSHSALSELRDLIAVWSAQPAPPATGDRDEVSKATEAAEDADVRAAGSGLPGNSDLTPTAERRHRTGAPRRHLLIGNIGSGGRQRQAPGRGTGTTRSSSAPIRQSQFTRAVRRITALSQSRQHRSGDSVSWGLVSAISMRLSSICS